MELKKTKKANLETKRNYFILVGLAVSMGIVLMVLGLSDQVEANEIFKTSTTDEGVTEIVSIPVTTEAPLPPPPPPMPQLFEAIIITEDNSKLPDFEFGTTEITEGIPIEIINAYNLSEEKHIDTNDSIFRVVEEMPEFPGGQLSLLKWIANHIKYPEEAVQNEVEGRVFVQFVVDKDGGISNALVSRGVDTAIDNEALRVVNSLPTWKPGKQRGKPVRVAYTVPIKFELKKE
jgi:protein TonB